MDMSKEELLSERIGQLETLVEELLKEDPAEEKIRKQMSELQIAYTTDPVERINRVLAALHPHEILDFEEN